MTPSDEIGKHSRLKICRRKPCRFKSGLGDHIFNKHWHIDKLVKSSDFGSEM